MNGWKDISTAPKDRDILVWFDHEVDPYHDPNDPEKLTDYAAHAEGPYGFLDGKGMTVAKWHEAQWEATDEYGSGFWWPGAWFSRGDFGHYEVVCNPTHWLDIEPPETKGVVSDQDNPMA